MSLFSHKKEIIFRAVPDASPGTVDFAAAEFAQLPVQQMIAQLERLFGITNAPAGLEPWHIQWRRWCSPQDGSISSLMTGASILATPYGRELLKQLGTIPLPKQESPPPGFNFLSSLGHFARVNAGSLAPMQLFEELQQTAQTFPLVLHPEFYTHLSQNFSPESLNASFDEQRPVQLGEQSLPKNMNDLRLTAAHMLGEQGSVGLIHQLFGNDAHWRHHSYIDYARSIGTDILFARLTIKHLLASGFLTPERVEILRQIADTHVCSMRRHLLRESFPRTMQYITAFRLLSMYDTVDSSQPWTTDVVRTNANVYSSNRQEIADGTFDLSTLFTPQLQQLATDLLEHLGWKGAEGWIATPLWVLKKAHQAAELDDGVWPQIKQQTVQHESMLAYRHFFTRTLVGKIYLLIEDLALQIDSTMRFSDALQTIGVPTTEPTFSSDRDAGVYLRDASAEHLHAINARNRLRSAVTAMGAHTRVLSSRDGESSFMRDFDGTLAAHYKKHTLQHTSFLGTENVMYVEQLVGDPVDESSHQTIFVTLIARALQLLEDLPIGGIKDKSTEEEVDRLVVLLSKYLHVKGLYQFGPDDPGGFHGEGLHVIIRELKQSKTLCQEIVANNLVLEPGVPLNLLGANGRGKSTLVATLCQQVFVSVRSLASASRLPESTRLFTSFDTVEQGGIESVRTARQGGKSSFMEEMRHLLPIVDALLERSDVPLLVVTDELGKRTDQLNGMSLVAMVETLQAVKKACALNAAHYNTLPELLSPIFEQLGLSSRWATIVGRKVVENAGTVFSSNALEEAMPLLPVSVLKTWIEIRGNSDVLAAEAANKYEKRTYEQLHIEGLRQIGWLKTEQYFNEGEQILGLAGFLLGSGRCELRAVITDEQRREHAQLPYIGHPDVRDLLVRTVLNPRWQLRAKTKEWIASLDQTAIKQLLDSLSPIGEVLTLSFGVQELQSIARDRDGSSYKQKHAEVAARFDAIRQSLEELKKSLSLLSQRYPELDWQGLSALPELVLRAPEVSAFSPGKGIIAKIFETYFALQSVACVAHNRHLLDFCSVESHRQLPLSVSLTDMWGAELKTAVHRSKKPLVENSIDFAGSLFFAGCQGSGKTEAVFGLAEALQCANLFGITTASNAKVNGTFEVMPLISVPQWPREAGEYPLSSWQREVAHRIAAVYDFCKSLPKGVAPVVVMDEVGISTNPMIEGSEIIRTITQIVESCGGIVIMATHCHQALWDFDRVGKPYTAMSVTPFWHEQAYTWIPGHGESLGLETAEQLGLHPKALAIAEVYRQYFLQVGKLPVDDPSLTALQQATAEKLRVLLSQL